MLVYERREIGPMVGRSEGDYGVDFVDLPGVDPFGDVFSSYQAAHAIGHHRHLVVRNATDQCVELSLDCPRMAILGHQRDSEYLAGGDTFVNQELAEVVPHCCCVADSMDKYDRVVVGCSADRARGWANATRVHGG